MKDARTKQSVVVAIRRLLAAANKLVEAQAAYLGECGIRERKGTAKQPPTGRQETRK